MTSDVADQHRAHVVGLSGILMAGVIVFLLFGLFFLKYEIVLLVGLLAVSVLIPLVLSRSLCLSKITLIVLLNYAYWLSSGFFVGAITLKDLLSMEFYNGEGRIFIAYLPLLLFSNIRSRTRDVRLLIQITKILALAGALLAIVWLALKPAEISGGAERIFMGFFTSHTGTGTFFGCISVLLLIYAVEQRDRLVLFFGLLALFAVIASASRQAILALAIVAIWYAVIRGKLKVVLALAIVISSMAGLTPLLAPETFERTAKLISFDTIRVVEKQLELANWEPGSTGDVIEEGDPNVLRRVLYWNYAVKTFVDSPVLGIGFGRFNDHITRMEGYPGVVHLATGGTKEFSVIHAHNSYLHLLSESGVVGLALMVLLWLKIARALHPGNIYVMPASNRAYLLACRGLVVFVLVGALVAHALAAPTLMLAVTIMIGIGISLARHSKMHDDVTESSPGAPGQLALGRY